jgi:glutamine amidotransferase-like uncharacterized protein
MRLMQAVLAVFAMAVAATVGAAEPLKVALYVDWGCRGPGVLHWARLLSSSPDTELDILDSADVLAGKLPGHDVLVMPGGGGYERHRQLGEKGFDAIRAFVRGGGLYYGTCAGFAVVMNEPRRLCMVPYKKESNPMRGCFAGAVRIGDRAAELMGIPAGTRHFFYHDGPLPAPSDPVPDSEYEVLATYESEVMQKGKAKSPMFGMPAIVFGRYGKGKVFVTIMHPEYFVSTYDVLAGGFRALSGRDVRFAPPPRKAPRSLRVAYYASEIDRNAPAITAREVVRDALALSARPDLDVAAVSGEDISHGSLDHVDVLVLPGGEFKHLWPESVPVVEAFKAAGGRIVASGAEIPQGGCNPKSADAR